MKYPIQIKKEDQESLSDIKTIHIGDYILSSKNIYQPVKAYLSIHNNILITYGKWKKKLIVNDTFFVKISKHKLQQISELTTEMQLYDIRGKKHDILSIEKIDETIKYPITTSKSFVCNNIYVTLKNNMTTKNKIMAFLGF